MINRSFTESMDTFLKIGVILTLLYWCFMLLKPFLAPVMWGAIIAVTLAPVVTLLANKLGGRKKMAATLVTLSMILLLIVPVAMLASVMIDDVSTYTTKLEEGNLNIPPPKDSVKEWPIVGENLYSLWASASADLSKTATEHESQIRTFVKSALSMLASLGGSILLFVFSAIISGIFLVKSDETAGLTKKLVCRIAGEPGESILRSVVMTIRNVTKGVLGVAVIQAVLAALGLMVMGIPGTPVIAIGVLILAVIQLSPILLLLPVSIYVFSTDISPVFATIFLVWNIVVSAMDTFLKPILMGKGSHIPTLVIFLGAIGGMILHGLVGLFVGAVVLVVSYELIVTWLKMGDGELAAGDVSRD